MLRDDSGNGGGRPSSPRNVLGDRLDVCSTEPKTGFFRDGCCNTNGEDVGSHTVCAVMTAAFLEFSDHPRPRQTRPGSGLRHVRRDLTGQKVLTHRSEEIDHLRIFGKEGFVLDPTRYHCDVLRLDCSLLTANP